MKRSPLERRTPLAPGAQLQRRTPIRQSRGRSPADGVRPREKRSQRPAVDPLWPPARTAALERDRYQCVICRSGWGLEVHHRYAKKMGGRMGDPNRHALSRLVTLCSIHHWAAHNASERFTQGWKLKEHQDPRVHPMNARGGWRVYDDTGGMSWVAADRAKELLAA